MMADHKEVDMKKNLIAAFDNRAECDMAIEELSSMGIDRSSIEIRDSETLRTTGDERKGIFSGFLRWLSDYGLAEPDTHAYAETVRRGGALLVVHSNAKNQDRIADVLYRHGAIDMDRRGEHYRSTGFAKFDESARPYSREESIAERERFQAAGEFVIPVVDEKVSVGKRKVDDGRVRVLRRIVEEPVERDVNLRDEHVAVERRTVDRALGVDDMEAFKEGEIELRESHEEAVVEKEARVREEVLVRRDVDEHTETVRTTARHSDVNVERSDANRRDR